METLDFGQSYGLQLDLLDCEWGHEDHGVADTKDQGGGCLGICV